MTTNILGATGALLLGAYLLMALLLWMLQEGMIFHPRALAEDDRERLARHVLVAYGGGGVRLSGWHLPGARQQQPLLVYFGGNAEEISDSLELFSMRLGLPAGGLNYRGYGDSAGRPTAADLRADALVAFDALVAASGKPAAQTVVVGRSLGSHMAAHVAANRKVGRVVLVTPFDRLSAVASKRYPIFPVRLLLRHELDTVAESARITSPALIISAGLDRVVPQLHAQALANEWAGGALAETNVAGAAHHDIYDFAQFWQILDSFVKDAGQGPPERNSG